MRRMFVVYAIILIGIVAACTLGYIVSTLLPWWIGVSSGAAGIIICLGNMVITVMEENE